MTAASAASVLCSLSSSPSSTKRQAAKTTTWRGRVAVTLLASCLFSAGLASAQQEEEERTYYQQEDLAALLEEQLAAHELHDLIEAAYQFGGRNGPDEAEEWTFTPEDEDELFDAVLAQAEEDILSEPSEATSDEGGSNLHDLMHMNKRFTVEFNGMQVSYPTYVRLTRLQAKVVRLRRMIAILHQRYSEEELEALPQYQRLMQLYNSLRPLLPRTVYEGDVGGGGGSGGGNVAASTSAASAGQQETTASAASPNKRFTMDFMGMQVSYPQYLRLKALQEKVIKLDQIVRKMRREIPAPELERVHKWKTVVALHESLKKLLPDDYLRTYPDGVEATKIQFSHRRSKRSTTTTGFNGINVSVPQYGRLMGMQKSALKLDRTMRQMVRQLGAEKLAETPEWQRLVSVRQSLQKLMPEGHPEFDLRRKRVMTMDFNGIQVSYPQYVHLMDLQKKVARLDTVMRRIATIKSPEELKRTPQWKKLVDLRKALVKLLPMEEDGPVAAAS